MWGKLAAKVSRKKLTTHQRGKFSSGENGRREVASPEVARSAESLVFKCPEMGKEIGQRVRQEVGQEVGQEVAQEVGQEVARKLPRKWPGSCPGSGQEVGQEAGQELGKVGPSEVEKWAAFLASISEAKRHQFPHF